MANRVTCIMPTYNRIDHPNRSVDESVEAFLRQDYPDKELIIFNDCAQQTIAFDHPDVKVINVPNRSSCLSDACNRAADAGTGDYVTLWTDDDIRLPWTLSVLIAELTSYEHVTIGPHFYSVNNQIVSLVKSAVYQTGIFSTKLFNDLGGYAIPLNQDHDLDLDVRALKSGRSRGPTIVAPQRGFLIYRWGDGHYHLSGHLAKFRGDPDQYIAQGNRAITPGKFTINPMWRVDYVAEAARCVSKSD